MNIEWNEKLATGNSEIDEQHKELFIKFNILLEACKQGKGKEEVSSLLNFLGEYVVHHFSTEETLQKEHDYPYFPEHKREHDGFIEKLHGLKNEFAVEGASIGLIIQTNQFIVNWLLKHINGTDKELGNFLNRSA